MKKSKNTSMKSQNRKKRASTRIRQVQDKLNSGNSRHHVNTFLEKYFLSEIATKEMLVGYQTAKGEHLEYGKAEMHYDDIKNAFKHYNLGLSEELIKRLYLGKAPKGVKRSAKKLRDSLVHGMTVQNITEVDDRYNQLITDLDAFLKVSKS